MNILLALQQTIWNLIDIVTGHGYRDHIDKVRNGTEISR